MVVQEEEGVGSVAVAGGCQGNGYRRWLLGQWLLPVAAKACAVVGSNYGLGYCRRRLRVGFFPLSPSLLLWVFPIGRK